MSDCRGADSSTRSSDTHLAAARTTPRALQTRRSRYAYFLRTITAAPGQRAGSISSLGDFLQDDIVDRELRDRFLRPRVLRF